MVIRSCAFSLRHNGGWVGRKELLVGFEPWPEGVNVVPEVDVSATKPSAGHSYFCLLPHFPLIFSILSCRLSVISHPNPGSLLTTTEWMNNNLLSTDISTCLYVPVRERFNHKMLSRATFPLLPHLLSIWSQISLRGLLPNTDHRGLHTLSDLRTVRDGSPAHLFSVWRSI